MRTLNMRWFFGKYGWICDDMVPIDPPVPCRGYQKLWTVGDREASIVRERWKAAKGVLRT